MYEYIVNVLWSKPAELNLTRIYFQFRLFANNKAI